MSGSNTLPFPVLPGYGAGVARRRIRLTASPGTILAELEDHAHAMRCRLDHENGMIITLAPEFLRFPLTTCTSAEAPLAELIGTPIGSAARDFFAGGRARRNCTHMLDLAWLASNHATRTEKVRDYEADIPDEIEGCTSAVLRRNGDQILEWRIENNVITEPSQFAGRQLYVGFTSWILDAAAQDRDLLEASLVLQKACFVTGARRYQPVPGPLRPAEKQLTAGVCHGYATTTIDKVERLSNFRDFSGNPESLLRFL
jgi:hypothetical protein